MNHASLFSGIGGFDLAAEIVGWTNVFHCENNSFCQQILNYYWPNAISYEDIKTTDFTRHRGQIDILTGGFPCQPFSQAGRRRGSADDRYLWPQMLRAIREIRPRWIVAENVVGLTGMVFPPQVTHVENQTSDKNKEIHRTLEAEAILYRICEDLEAEGYQVVPIVIPACSVGAPHRRDRVYLIAYTDRQRGERGQYHRQARSVQNDQEWNPEKTQQAGHQHQSQPGQDRRPGAATDTTRERLEGTPEQRVSQTSGRRGESPAQFHFAAWLRAKIQATNGDGSGNGGRGNFFQGFPTQLPICSGDDGLSTRLDGVTVSRLRKESLKGYGNAVVVPLVVEIFRAIEEVDKVAFR